MRPGVVPVEAVGLFGGAVEFTDEVPESMRATLSGGAAGGIVLVTTDRHRPEVEARIAAGERVIAAPSVPGDGLVEAVDVMDRLWGFGGWEVTQTHDSLRRYLLEETYELLDAIEEGDPHGLREELGDLLLQVLFHSRIAQESGTDPFTVDDVARGLVTKLALRSPHLTDGHTGPIDVAEQERAWEAAKAAEKARASCLDGIAMAQPALALAEKVIERATRAGLPPELVPDELRLVRIAVGDNAEDALRKAVLAFAARIRATEVSARTGGESGRLDARAWIRFW
ncbi:nucleoside triphosphate pyrophosphohydrolase [Rhodococcus olei]|uniref:Nucleoside triphosphate pyrophosphohydrolase n=2 Tax=Rhodococcus olei TaxID=2161675 RepID=A0ABP8NU50_9NOCA